MGKYAKAVVGALVAGLGSLQMALLSGSDSGTHLSASELVVVAIATLTALTAVWATSNK